ncbi:MAG: ATP-binding protein [Planctomycetes bacterium]|nr:ATP-binding protein [Planctomycetota bacterium]
MKLDVKIEKNSILKNITHFFSKEDAYIQELLQNARRAEAAQVRVAIDLKACTLTVQDDGHGVADPQSLLDIGKSEWAEGIKQETPAGMGFYSVFKLGDKASIRSRRFELVLDINELRRGGQAQLVESLPDQKGTTITVQSDAARMLDGRDINKVSIEHLTEQWKKHAAFMPFTTVVVVNGEQQTVVPAFDPRKRPADCLLRVEKPWGYVDVLDGHNVYVEHRDKLVSQGVAVSLKSRLKVSDVDDALAFRVLCRPGTVNFTLPDRDDLIADRLLKDLVTDVRASLVEGALTGLPAIADPVARRKVATLVYAYAEHRSEELPEDLQWVEVTRGEYHTKMSKAELSRMMSEGAEVCTQSFDRGELLAFMPIDVLVLREGREERFRRMFPAARVIKRVELHVEADTRGDTLWQVRAVKLGYEDGEVRQLPPKSGVSLLSCNEFDAELVANDAEVDGKRTEENFIVLHSCTDEVAQPDLEVWHEDHDENYSYDESQDFWRTGVQNLDIIRTWRGIPGRDMTLSELEAVLRDKLKLDRDDTISLRDATIEDLDETVNIRKATVVVQHDGQPNRQVVLEEVGDRLVVVTGT